MRTLLLLMVVLAISCTENPKTPTEIAIENIEKLILESAHDPDSYEFIKMDKLDTVWAKDHYSKMLSSYQKQLKEMSEYPEQIQGFLQNAKTFKRYGEEYQAERAESFANEMQEEYDLVQTKINEFQSLHDSSDEETIKEIKTTFKCRANNLLGVKILNTIHVTLSDSLTVTDVKYDLNL